MLVMPYLFRSLRSGGHAAVGIGGQASDGRLCAGSYEVTPPGRSRATTSSAGPTDRPKDSNPCVRLTESQTRRKTSAISSLAYETGTGDVAGAAGQAGADRSGGGAAERSRGELPECV